MIITYEIILTIVNLTNDQTETFQKNFDYELEGLSDKDLYDNYHNIATKVQMFTLFKREINDYCDSHLITVNNIDIDEFNINSLTDRVDVYFEPGDGDDPNQISLEPNIKCYVYPKYDELQVPNLIGKAYDNHSIIWSWEDDGQAHYLVSEAIDINTEEHQDKIIAQIPIGTNTYVEVGLEPDTDYTRRLIAYNSEQTSGPSHATTIRTATSPIDQSLEQYEIPKVYDYTSDDTEREIIQENLEAFHSGIGDYNDLKVYKQMDADFYQKFKAYIQLRGARTQREKRYDSVGFNYKVCLESIETVEEQKGEVTFDIDVYPIEKVSIKDYMYACQPVTVCARMRADVLLKKRNDNTEEIVCPLEEPVWEEQTKRIENTLVQEDAPPFDGDLTIVLSFDISGSMTMITNGLRRWNIVKDAALRLIDQIEGYSKGGVPLAGKVRYCLTFWAEDAKSEVVQTAAIAKHVIESVRFDFSRDVQGTVTDWGWTPCNNATNHQAGLTDWMTAQNISNAVIEMFYTDGFANTYNGRYGAYNIVYAKIPSLTYQTLYQSIHSSYETIKSHNVPIYTLFGADYNVDYDAWSKPTAIWRQGIPNAVWEMDKDIYDIHVQHATKIDKYAYAQYTVDNILNSMWNGLKKLIDDYQSGNSGESYYVDEFGNRTDDPYEEVFDGWEFEGWKDAGEDITLTANWNIDECKWARVYIPPLNEDPWTITINDTMTPIVYARNEQRAIIPSDSIIGDRNFDQAGVIRQGPIKVDSRSIQDMILAEVRNTNEWKSGYNQLVEAYSDEDKKQGHYIIRGLIIKDTYKYADEDKIPDVYFGDDGLEDGYVGSINVYADINKLNTSNFGDDVYAVGPDKYVWLSGYTDAIIYDGERIESFELNAANNEPGMNDPNNHQTEILLSPSEDYRKYLWNRKKRISTNLHDIQYTGTNNVIRHALDVVDMDNDIYITGTDKLKRTGDWVLFVPPGTNISDTNKIVRGVTYPVIEHLTQDVIAHNDEHYISPILNYRFNYEDPDAYTSYYELLPDCDPFSPYLNIVFVHIYYARNIYIQDENKLSGDSSVYIESFGDNNIATRFSPFYLNSRGIEGQTYFRDEYIDDYVWFQAKPMYETRPYYDEKPNPGMDSFYGNVNGRYRENNKSGKKDLRVVTPQFNLPTTIDAENIKIYIIITEFYPDTALVSYAWDHPSSIKDSITNVNGDYVTFSSDSLTYKDVVYNELLQTTTSKPIELFDSRTVPKYFELDKPLSRYTYDHYYIEVFSDNSDVLALNYPSEIVFDENSKAEFGVNFKGVVNATTKWSPHIHNGYYYLNQHEYYAYSEFNVEADFEKYTEDNFKTINGYATIDVDILRKAGNPEHYDIMKNTRSELLQNEKEFTWVNGKGLTIKPKIDGEYYKEYTAHVYVSPVIIFPNTLTSAGVLKVECHFEDGSEMPPMQVRSYSIENGAWSEWTSFANDSVPNVPLSCAYQVQFTVAASTTNNPKSLEDYLCCYLDWVDDGDTPNHTNCVTITDHLQAGPYESDGIFNSKIIDFGCETTISLDIFASNLKHDCTLYIATESTNKDRLLLENIIWTRADSNTTVTTRFLRYRIVIPYGEKVYWLHKKIITKETSVLLPYIEEISMSGDYEPVDTYDTFQEIQSFEITTDGNQYQVFPSIYDIISGDVQAKGFTADEIHYVRINSTEHNIQLQYASEVLDEFPTLENLKTPIYATADFETEISVKNTPFIYATVDPLKKLDVLLITKGTPQQYAPITMEDTNGIPYKEVFDVDPDTLIKTEDIEILTEDDKHYIKLSRNDFDIKSLSITLNNNEFTNFRLVNNLIIFDEQLNINDKIQVKYNILNSFYTEIDYDNDKTQMTIYSDYDSEIIKREGIETLTPIVTEYTITEGPVPLGQFYMNGVKQAINREYVAPDSNWRYDTSLNAIRYLYNVDDFSIIVNNMSPVHTYNMSVVTYSTDADQDVIGFVIGYIKDSDNVYHTLSYLISLADDYLFNGNNTAIVLDYARIGEFVVASKNVSHDGYINWNDMVNGIKMSIVKTEDDIQCKISNWDDLEHWNEDSKLTARFDSSERLRIFNQPVYYGFCVRSQKDTYFLIPEVTATVNKTITIEEQIKSMTEEQISALNLKHRYKVYFETNKNNNKFIASNLSMNPVYRTDYKGFIYLTDEHNEPYTINIYRNPKYIKAGGYDKIDVSIECLDYEGNPVISKAINVDCDAGILNFDDDNSKHLTDMNGVIHLIYESAIEACHDTITASTITSDGTVIESSVEIINE